MTDEARASLQAALPAYEVLDKLGQGAFGMVYEARHTQLGRMVAIKQLPRGLADDDGVRERFVAEAQMVASIDHPHVVPVYDFVESEGSRYLIMERCQGSVADRFRTEGLVTDETCAAVLACLAGLDVAHRKGLLHRDVKPENLMYDVKGVVKLADFGIARDTDSDTRRTATGMIIGTPAYMSPEQCRGDELTAASDVYSVGIMAYELLTGGLPYPESNSVNGLIAHHLVTEPLPLLAARPELAGTIGAVIDRSLAKDLSVRHATAEEFATDLAEACVQAFGSGWLRRRRFVLHWPEIIAVTEQPAPNSPRTGTISVRAGDLTHDYIPEAGAQTEPAAAAPTPVPDSSPTETPGDPTVPLSPSPEPASSAPDRSQPATRALAASATPNVASATGESAKRPSLPLIAGLAAAVVAAVVAAVLILGGGDGGDDGGDDVATETPTNPTAVATQAPEVAVAPTKAPEPTQAPEATAAPTPQAAAPAPTPLPTVVDPARFVPTEAPPDLDLTQLLFPGSPRPCPEAERRACIFAFAHDEDTDVFEIFYWVEGFVPELDPAGYHLHFYIDNAIDGDESRAGRNTPGGSWRAWDHPWPATSFGGDNGRTIFTGAEFLAANGRNVCVLVADADQNVIPQTGNCVAPIISSDDTSTNRFIATLNEGTYAGTCAIGLTAGIPPGWRWFDLTEGSLDETARMIRPGAISEGLAELESLVDAGGVIYADGPPPQNGEVPTATYAIWPGDFTINDSASSVRDKVGQLGIDLPDAVVRQVADREFLITLSDQGGIASATYVVPDFGYAIAMTLTLPGGGGQAQELADQMAMTVLGC